MFNVINVETGDFLLLADGTVATFPDGKAAAVAAQVRSRLLGVKHKTQRVVAQTDWRARELSRFESGEYMPVAWAKAMWWRRRGDHLYHYAHVSKNNPKLVAYTESEERGLEDKQAVIKPGAYLKKYFGGYLSSVDIASYAAQHGSLYGDDTKLVITRDPAEIEKVYRNGPSSCMVKSMREFNSPFHPARLYGEPGDLGLAYLLNDGHITARTVVWPEKKIFIRIYGDDTRLRPLLSKEGYFPGTLDGARMPKHETDHERYVAPYLDSIGAVDIEDKFLVIRTGGEVHCGNTDGIIARPPLQNCSRCNASLRHNGNNFKTVFLDENIAARNSALWCVECATKDTYYCQGTGYLHNGNAIVVGGKQYSPYYVNQYMVKCQKTDAWCERGSIYVVCVGYNDRGRKIEENWGPKAVTKFSFQDDMDGHYYSNDMRSTDYSYLCVKNAEAKKKQLERKSPDPLGLAPSTLAFTTLGATHTISPFQNGTFDSTFTQTGTTLTGTIYTTTDLCAGIFRRR